MNITEIKIMLAADGPWFNEHIRAFASLVINDELCIRDLKVLQGNKGLFVAMPSRKILDRCDGCGTKNHLSARFCNQCGSRLDEHRAPRDEDGRSKLHSDVCHPIARSGRIELEAAVLAAYEAALGEQVVAAGERGAA